MPFGDGDPVPFVHVVAGCDAFVSFPQAFTLEWVDLEVKDPLAVQRAEQCEPFALDFESNPIVPERFFPGGRELEGDVAGEGVEVRGVRHSLSLE